LGSCSSRRNNWKEMTNNSDSVANGGEVNALWRGGWRQRQFRNGMERSSFLSSAGKFALQVLLRDVEIAGHVPATDVASGSDNASGIQCTREGLEAVCR
jgi:hypothetical protein